jgi:2-methylcitrate dehydratase PrpD
MDETKKLAAFCSRMRLADVPAEVVHKAKLCLLDWIANIYGSLELDAVQAVVAYCRALGGPEQAHVLGCAFRTSVSTAAFLNGVTAEAIEAQDGVRFGGNHPVSAVMPAVFAVAEHERRSGREVLEAVIAGYEACCRPAAAMHPYHTLSGFLPTGTCGAFGAAAAAARLMHLDESGMLNALGNAGYLLPLSMAEQLMGGHTIKIVQGGQAACAGIMAAGLAQAGITGCPQVLEGSDLKGGFTQITLRAEPKCERITDRLGEHFAITDVYFKPYTACRHTHGAAQAALGLRQDFHLAASEVDKVEVYTYGVAHIAVGKGLINPTFVAAQFSIPYVVAVCLLDGELGPNQLTEKRIADPEVIALSKRVSVLIDEELNKIYPDKTSSRLELLLKDGRRVIRQVDIPKGDPRDPMATSDIVAKLGRFAQARDKAVLERLVELVMDIENLPAIDEMCTLI